VRGSTRRQILPSVFKAHGCGISEWQSLARDWKAHVTRATVNGAEVARAPE
jgi:hypothetical protein